MSDRQRRWLRYLAFGVAAFLIYAFIVWTYFQFETFSNTNETLSFGQAVWYVTLNPTGLGDTTVALYPSTLPGRAIGIVFALTGIGLLGVFVGKVTDVFNEIRQQAHLGRRSSDLSNHVVILGWDGYSKQVARELVRSDIHTVIVTADKSEIDHIRDAFEREESKYAHPVFAEYDNVSALQRFANIAESSRVFLNRKKDTDTLISLLNLNGAADSYDLSFVVRVRNERLLDRFDLENKDVDVTPVWTFGVASALVASYIYEPEVAEFGHGLVEATDYQLQQYRVDNTSEFCREAYESVFDDLMRENIFLLGVVKAGRTGRDRLRLLPDTDESTDIVIEPDDYLIVGLDADQENRMETLAGSSQGLASVTPTA